MPIYSTEYSVPVVPQEAFKNKYQTSEEATKKVTTWNPTDKEAERKGMIDKRIEDEMIVHRFPHEQKWRRNIERFMGQVYDDQKSPKRSRVVTKDVFVYIDAKLAEKTRSMPRYIITPVEPNDSWKAWVMEQSRNHAESTMGYHGKYHRWVFHKLLFGVGIMRIGHKLTYKTIRLEASANSEDGVEVRVPDYDDLFCYNVSPFKFLVDPNALSLDDAEDCAEFRLVNWNEFQDDYHMSPWYKNTEHVMPGVWHSLDPTFQRQANMAPTDQVLIVEYFNKRRDMWVTYANGVEIRYSPLPDQHKQLPYADLHNKPNFGSTVGRIQTGESEYISVATEETFWSQGDADIIGQEQDQKTAFRRAHLDGAKRANTNIIATDGFVLDSTMTDWYQGTPVVGGMNRIQVMPLGRTDPSYVQVVQELQQDMTKEVGVNPDVLISEKKQTATQSAIERESMLTRVQSDNIVDENTGIRRLGLLMSKLIVENYRKKQLTRITGNENIEEFEQVIPDANGEPLYGARDRRIVSEHKIREITTSDGKYEITFKDGNSNSFAMRPNYVMSSLGFDVRVEPESTVAPSRELEKAKAMEAMRLAAELMAYVQQGFLAPEDVPNVKYLSKRWMMAMGYDLQEAMGNQQAPQVGQGVQNTVDTVNQFRAGKMSGGGGVGAGAGEGAQQMARQLTSAMTP
tara:strand:+ start:7087 stop:9135 length:2049 start_codon:yes stop_codon:yes gene_type:complete